jgi:hypothetical protein
MLALALAMGSMGAADSVYAGIELIIGCGRLRERALTRHTRAERQNDPGARSMGERDQGRRTCRTFRAPGTWWHAVCARTVD